MSRYAATTLLLLVLSGPAARAEESPGADGVREVTKCPRPVLVMQSGERVRLRVGPVARLTGGSQIVGCAVTRDGAIELTGLAPGRTTVLIWTTRGHSVTCPIRVVGPDKLPEPRSPDAPDLAPAVGIRPLVLAPGRWREIFVPDLIEIEVETPDVLEVRRTARGFEVRALEEMALKGRLVAQTAGGPVAFDVFVDANGGRTILERLGSGEEQATSDGGPPGRESEPVPDG